MSGTQGWSRAQVVALVERALNTRGSDVDSTGET
jgi:hypothetical protein